MWKIFSRLNAGEQLIQLADISWNTRHEILNDILQLLINQNYVSPKMYFLRFNVKPKTIDLQPNIKCKMCKNESRTEEIEKDVRFRL